MSHPLLKLLGLKGSDIAVDVIYDPCRLPFNHQSQARPKPTKSLDRWKSFECIEQLSLTNPPSRSDSNPESQTNISITQNYRPKTLRNRQASMTKNYVHTEHEHGKISSNTLKAINCLISDNSLDDIMELPRLSKPKNYSKFRSDKVTTKSSDLDPSKKNALRKSFSFESSNQSLDNRSGRNKAIKSGNLDSESVHVPIESSRHLRRIDRWSNSDRSLSLDSVSDHIPRLPGRRYNPTSPSVTNRSTKLSLSDSDIDKITC